MTSLFSLPLSFYLSLSTPALVLSLPPDSIHLPLTNTAPGVFISDWEPATSWATFKNQEIIQYSLKRILPELQLKQLKESQLIVFVKGYQFKDTAPTEKPLSLPFYFFIPEENALKPIYWNYTRSAGKVDIMLQAPLELEEKLSQTKGKVLFRYFILDKAFLKQQKLSPKALRNLSYQQLLKLTSKKA